jgi:hypothetical protein
MRLSMQFLVGSGRWVILEDWQARAVSRRGLLAVGLERETGSKYR